MKKWIFTLAAAVAAASSIYAADPAIGAKAPEFSLSDSKGNQVHLSDYKGKIVVLEWTNFGCPFVKKHYDSGNMQEIQRRAEEKGAVWLSICSSAKGKEGFLTADEWEKALAEKKSNATALLIDADGRVGKDYGAKTTPHMFVVDASGVLVYKGAIDNKPSTDKEDVKGASNYVLNAVTEVASGQSVAEPATQSYGCSVKY